MKHIEFRAWHETAKEMVYFSNEKMKHDIYIAKHFFELAINGKLMQYIGRKDVEGVKLFEGDIVEAPDFWGEGKEGICVIGFNNGTFTVEDKSGDIQLPVAEWGYEDEENTHLLKLGNIHQNAELMN